MSEYKRPIISKIPGTLMPVAPKETHVKDLTKLSRLELLDIREREAKLLSNKTKLAILPDKGKRIQDFYNKIVAELERRSNVDEAAALFSELNIAEKGVNSLNELEWQGRLDVNGKIPEIDPIDDVLDSDDELELDPLKIIAQKTMHERRTKVLPPEQPLITEKDLEEIKSFNDNKSDSGVSANNESRNTSDCSEEPLGNAVEAEILTIDISKNLPNIKSKLKTVIEKVPETTKQTKLPDVEQHVLYLVEKTEHHHGDIHRQKFMPYKTTKTDVHAPEKERERKQGKHWEITAATPPPLHHNGTQMLSLLDSVQIQENYLKKLRELQEQQAAARLAAKTERLEQRKLLLPDELDAKVNPVFTKYRDIQIEGIQSFSDVSEVHDNLDDKPGGGVSYTYTVDNE